MLERESAWYNILLTEESLSIPIARADVDADADVVTTTTQERYLPVSFDQAIDATMPFFTTILAFFITCKKETGEVYLALLLVVFGIVVVSNNEAEKTSPPLSLSGVMETAEALGGTLGFLLAAFANK